MKTKKNILLIGASGFIARHVADALEKSGEYTLLKIMHKATGDRELELDFSDVNSINRFSIPEGMLIDGVFFLQGINPSKNTKETSYNHFLSMLQVHVIGPALLIKKIHNQFATGALVLFITSVAARKGSYDPAYASAKAALTGLMYSLANEFTRTRFNTLSLGLVENSPVDKGMTEDFRKHHRDRMFENRLVQITDVVNVIELLLKNKSICTAHIPVEAGFKM